LADGFAAGPTGASPIAAECLFPRCWFNDSTTEAGRDALGYYHERQDEKTARYRLPAAYAGAAYAGTSALMSYGVDWIEQYRRAASYVDRILKGERPADLPVQAPTKYALVINLKTAKALGLTVPQSLLALADEVIE